MSDDENFDKGEAGSADCVPTQAGSVKKGGYCMLKGFPCKVIEYSTAKPGKHGSAKATIVGVDIFTNKKYEDGGPTSSNMMVPNVSKVDYEVADVNADDGFVSLIMDDGTLKQDLKLPADEDINKELNKMWEEAQGKNPQPTVCFTVVRACGQEKIVSGRIKEQ